MAGIPQFDNRDLALPFDEYLARWFRSNLAIRDGLRRGLADIKAGRVTPWANVKRQLNLQPEEEKQP